MALSSDNAEIPSTSDAIASFTSLPRRSEITISPASHHEIEEISHTEEENDLEEDSRQQDILTRQPSMPSGAFQGNIPGSKSKLHSLLAKTDSAAAVGQFQNNRYLALERLPANLPRFRESVEALHLVVQDPDIPQKERNELTRLTLDLMHKIDRVSTEKTASRKLATKLFFSMASIGFCILPLLTAKKNNDLQYLSLLIAGYAKTMLMLVGFGLSRTADAKSFSTHLKERHIPYLIPTLPYALSAYNKQTKDFEDRHPWAFNGAAAAFTGAIFLLSSAPHLVTGPINRMYNRVKDCLDSNRDTGTNITTTALAEQLKDDLGILANAFRTQHEAMIQRRNEFEKSGNQLSDVLSTQVSDIDDAAMKLDDSLNKLLGGETSDPISGTITRANDDLSKKMVFTILAAILCAGSAATYYDEPVGLIDLGTDAGLTIGEMTKTMLNPAETGQRAAEKFASYSGLAPLLLPFGIINKIPATHFTDSAAGLVVGAMLLTCGNLTLPRPTAELLSQLIMKLIDRVKASREGHAESNAERGTEMARNSSVRITELTDDGDDGMTAHSSDTAVIASVDDSAPVTAIEIAANELEQSGPQPGMDRLDIVIGQSETQALPNTKVDKQRQESQ